MPKNLGLTARTVGAASHSSFACPLRNWLREPGFHQDSFLIKRPDGHFPDPCSMSSRVLRASIVGGSPHALNDVPAQLLRVAKWLTCVIRSGQLHPRSGVAAPVAHRQTLSEATRAATEGCPSQGMVDGCAIRCSPSKTDEMKSIGSLPSGTYSITISKSGYTSTTDSNVSVSGHLFYQTSFP